MTRGRGGRWLELATVVVRVVRGRVCSNSKDDNSDGGSDEEEEEENEKEIKKDLILYTLIVYIHNDWMHDIYVNFRFLIQIQIMQYTFNGESVYIVSIYKINS